MAQRPFVKAADTKVSQEKSRLEVERMLRRYGATGFSFMTDLERGEMRVEFVVPNSPRQDAPRIPVRIPVNVVDVFRALYPGCGHHDAQYCMKTWPPAWQRAERVAWRNLVVWMDAALSAASIGLRTIADTFAADRLVTDDSGNTMRVAELLERAGGALPHGGRLLMLGSGNATT